MQRYLYFRKCTSIGDDDDGANGSSYFPVDNIKAMIMGNVAIDGANTDDDNGLSITFEPAGINGASGDADAGDNDIDVVLIEMNVDNSPQPVMKAIVRAINEGPHSDGIISIFDGVNGTKIHDSISDITIRRAVND